VLHFARHVLPAVRRDVPQVTLTVVGRQPSGRLRAALAGLPVEATGGVPDVRPYVARAAVYVVPLRGGASTRATTRPAPSTPGARQRGRRAGGGRCRPAVRAGRALHPAGRAGGLRPGGDVAPAGPRGAPRAGRGGPAAHGGAPLLDGVGAAVRGTMLGGSAML